MTDFEYGDFESRLRVTSQDIARLALGEFSVLPDDGPEEDRVRLNPDAVPPYIGGIALKPLTEAND